MAREAQSLEMISAGVALANELEALLVGKKNGAVLVALGIVTGTQIHEAAEDEDMAAKMFAAIANVRMGAVKFDVAPA